MLSFTTASGRTVRKGHPFNTGRENLLAVRRMEEKVLQHMPVTNLSVILFNKATGMPEKHYSEANGNLHLLMPDLVSRAVLALSHYSALVADLEFVDAQIGMDPEYEKLPCNIKAAYQRIHSALLKLKEWR